MVLGIVQTAKLTVIYAVVLYGMVTRQFNVTNVRCGFTMNALTSQKPCMKLHNSNCTWICPKCDFFNVSDSFFDGQLKLENQNRFDPLTKEKKTRSSSNCTKKQKKKKKKKNDFVSGLKFVSMNINSIRGKKLELLAFLYFHQPYVVAIQETKIDSAIATSELFPETCPYSVYRKDRNLHGGV